MSFVVIVCSRTFHIVQKKHPTDPEVTTRRGDEFE
jgi:hypothetical protein